MSKVNDAFFQTEFEKRFVPLSKKLTKLEDKMLKLISEGIKNGRNSTLYWNTLNVELRRLYREMSISFYEWSSAEIPRAYKKSMFAIDARLKSLTTITESAGRTTTSLLKSNVSSQIMNNLYKGAVDSYISAIVAGNKNMSSLLRITQQALLSESLIEATIAGSLELGNLRIGVKAIEGQLWQSLAEAAENKRFVQAGKYKYRPEYYAELVGRTKFHQAQSQAAIVQANNYGTDLVQISSHNTRTTICLDFEGKIFSLSGKDPRFPAFTFAPPFHPNCLHLMFPTFESGLVAQGVLDSMSAFSRGEISRPPFPKSFIPIDKRKIA